MAGRTRNSIFIVAMLCLAYAVAGAFFCWPPDGAASAGGNSAVDALPSPQDGGAFPVSRTVLELADRTCFVYWPPVEEEGAATAALRQVAQLLGVAVAELAPSPASAEVPPGDRLPPEDSCGRPLPEDTAELVRPPCALLISFVAHRPTEGITSLNLTVTDLSPGAVTSRCGGTVVYDRDLRRAVQLADLFAVDDKSRARLDGVLTRVAARQSDAAWQPASADSNGFLLLREGMVFCFGSEVVSAGGTSELFVTYRELAGLIQARIGYPDESAGATYPAYIAIGQGRDAGRGDPSGEPGPVIALTFDDGPNDLYTRAILAELSKRRAVGTFCVIGVNSVTRQDILQDIVLQGSEIGNHTWRHWDLRTMTPAEVQSEVGRLQRFVESVTGIAPAFVRPPWGHASPEARAALGLPAVYWSIDPHDYTGISAEAIAEHVIARARDGDIVLLHDTTPHTAAATGMILDELGARGFRFVTVSELLDLRSGAVKPGSIWRNRDGG